jgi:hypothetical protein
LGKIALKEVVPKNHPTILYREAFIEYRIYGSGPEHYKEYLIMLLREYTPVTIIHILQRPTSGATKSTETTMVHTPKKNFSPHLPGRYGNQQCVQSNDVIERMKARVAWRQRESEPWGHCAACDPK